MNTVPLLTVQAEQVIPRRIETVAQIVGNTFAASLAFQGLPYIVDRTSDSIAFKTTGVIPGPWFRTTGRLQMIEEGVKTRVAISIHLHGLLLLSYALFWIPVIALWFVQSFWMRWINPETVTLIEGWIVMVCLIAPAFLFLLFRRRIRIRLATYVNNLIYYW